MGNLPEFIDDSQCVFKGTRFSVFSLDIPNKEGRTKKDVVIHPGAVVILPKLDDNTVVMIKNNRFAVGQELWELPAGTLEPSEFPQDTAARELIEETGYRADSIQLLTQFYTTPGFCNEMMYAFLAEGLHEVGQQLEDTECITVHLKKWDELLSMIQEGKIVDGKTITTLLYYHTFL